MGDLDMNDGEVLRLVLSVSEDQGRSFDFAEIKRWPQGVFEFILKHGLISRASGQLVASCPECDGAHREEVFTDSHGGVTRYFINCPEQVQVEVEEQHCVRWEPSIEGLTAVIRESIQVTSAFKEIYPQRLWRLGRFQWNGRSRELLLARGLGQSDAARVMVKVPPAGKAVVLVPDHVPDDRGWPNRIPVVIAISDYLDPVKGKLVLNASSFLDAIHDADHRLRERGQVSLDAIADTKVKASVEKYISSKLNKTEVIDAVIRFGGISQAIKELKAEGNDPPSRATVYRWLDDLGGTEALRRRSDWGSMVNLKMSHPGDRGKKVDAATK